MIKEAWIVNALATKQAFFYRIHLIDYQVVIENIYELAQYLVLTGKEFKIPGYEKDTDNIYHIGRHIGFEQSGSNLYNCRRNTFKLESAFACGGCGQL